MKVIIAGTRDFKDYGLLKIVVNQYHKIYGITEVVSGTAKGADELGERWAKENNIPIKKFPAEWKKHGRAAGPIRNEQMAEYADYLIAFWDGTSKGTKNMIDNMEKRHKTREVLFYTNHYDIVPPKRLEENEA